MLVKRPDKKTEVFMLFNRSIETTWTPIKPVTTQFTVGRTKSAQVVRKQFPLRPASAKTVHRSQGDTQSQIVVNLNTKGLFLIYIMLL